MSTLHLTVNAKSIDGIVCVLVLIEYNLRLLLSVTIGIGGRFQRGGFRKQWVGLKPYDSKVGGAQNSLFNPGAANPFQEIFSQVKIHHYHLHTRRLSMCTTGILFYLGVNYGLICKRHDSYHAYGIES